MAKSAKEKLQIVLNEIDNENRIIKKAKDKIKTLNVKKRKLERQIQNEEFEELRNVLVDYGIRNKQDFEGFIDKTTTAQNWTPDQQETKNKNFFFAERSDWFCKACFRKIGVLGFPPNERFCISLWYTKSVLATP